MVIIGITGLIGSGKSIIRDWFRNQGVEVIDVDQAAYRYLEPDQDTYRQVVQAFGEGILDSNGRINRSRLGKLVFQSPDQLESLNRIIHPPLVEWLRDRMRRFRAVGGKQVLVIDAALLFQWGLERDCDLVIWVDAPREIRKERVLALQQLSADEFERRDRLQSGIFQQSKGESNIEKVENSGSISTLENRIKQIWKKVMNHER